MDLPSSCYEKFNQVKNMGTGRVLSCVFEYFFVQASIWLVKLERESMSVSSALR